jgi:hypothetical protein
VYKLLRKVLQQFADAGFPAGEPSTKMMQHESFIEVTDPLFDVFEAYPLEIINQALVDPSASKTIDDLIGFCFKRSTKPAKEAR